MDRIQFKLLSPLISSILWKRYHFHSRDYLRSWDNIICRLGSFVGLDSTSVHPGTELREFQMIGPLKEKSPPSKSTSDKIGMERHSIQVMQRMLSSWPIQWIQSNIKLLDVIIIVHYLASITFQPPSRGQPCCCEHIHHQTQVVRDLYKLSKLLKVPMK